MSRQEYTCDECGSVIYFEGICYECRQRLKREAYQALTEVEVEAKARAIIAALGALGDKFYTTNDQYEDFFGLLAYKGISTAAIAEAAAEAEVYYPYEIYRDAAPEVRGKLIALVMQPDCGEADHILQCLAIAGGDDVLAAFIRLERNPLPWSENLFVPPSVYARAGGWTFDSEGRRVELNFGRCYPVFPLANGAGTDKAVTVATPRADVCPQCGTGLMDIVTLDGRDERLAFLNLAGVIKIPVCPQCATMCERTLVRYSPGGDSTMELIDPFGDETAMPESEYAEMTSRKFALAERPENLFFARGNDESIITVGGFADWIQDFQYDACPDCGKPMRYFASVPWNALSDWTEGTLFLEICPDCRVISAFHQQT